MVWTFLLVHKKFRPHKNFKTCKKNSKNWIKNWITQEHQRTIKNPSENQSRSKKISETWWRKSNVWKSYIYLFWAVPLGPQTYGELDVDASLKWSFLKILYCKCCMESLLHPHGQFIDVFSKCHFGWRISGIHCR